MWEKFKQKFKQAGSSRAVYVTVITLLLALAVLITATAISARAKKNDKDKLPSDSNTPGEFEDNKGGNTPEPSEPDDTPKPPSDGTESQPPAGGTNDETPTVSDVPELSLPVSGSVTKGHDTSIQVFSTTTGDYRIHLGVDMSTEANAPVLAAADGVVSRIWDDALMGKCLAISHSGDCYTIYKNLANALPDDIAEGVEVLAGQQIATVGETATLELAEEPHLHMEMTVKGLAVDPMEYFSAQALAAIGTDNTHEEPAQAETE